MLQYDLEASDSEEAEAIASNNRDTFRRALEFYVTATESAGNEDERWSKMQDFLGRQCFASLLNLPTPVATYETALYVSSTEKPEDSIMWFSESQTGGVGSSKAIPRKILIRQANF